MSSLRSHFHHSRQQHNEQQQSSNQPQKQSTRIPTKPVSAESGKPGKPVQHVSKLAKRSRSVKSSEPSVKSSTTRTATPVTGVVQNSIGTSKGMFVPPPGVPAASAPLNMRTPSLVSGSSVSTYDSPRSVLRRKPSGAIDRYAAQKRSMSSGGEELERRRSQSRNDTSREMFDDTVLGISMPSATASHFPLELSQQAYEKDFARAFTTPIPPCYAPSATPSTRYTDSPFSHVPTPSSASSYSPGLVATSNNVPRPRLSSSPARSRPPLSGRSSSKEEAPRLGLPPVRESSTSSSNSTVRAGARLAQARKAPPGRTPEMPSTRKPTDPSKPVNRPMQARSTRVTSSNQNPVQVPPELAHLNVDMASPSKTITKKSPPPARPTRDGTSTISDMSRPSPVVQSDLPQLYTTYHKRTPSQETPISSSSPSFKSRFGFSSRSSSRNESPRIDSAVSPPPMARNFHRGQSPQITSAEGAKLRRKDSPAVGTNSSPAKTSSRFGIFSRKPKSEPPKQLEKPKRQPSKGPVAGTGHEGYGRFGFRGRSGSMSSSGGFRSPSTDSGSSRAPRPSIPPPRRKSSTGSKDGSDLDDFLRERLNPVILRGSGSTGGNTASSSDLPGTSLHPASSNSSSLDGYGQPQLLPSAIQEHSTGSPVKRPPMGRRQLSGESSEDDVATRYPNLAARRSITRLSSADHRSTVPMPAPINTNIPVQKAAVNSYDTETSAWPQTDTTMPPTEGFLEREGLWLRSPQSESTVRSPRKWNFFQRVTSSPRSKGKEKTAVRHEVPEIAAHQSPYRGVAHYAMPGSVEPIGLSEVERIAQEYETSAEDSMSETNAPSKMVPYEKRHKSLLPSPPKREYSNDSDFRARPNPPRINVERQDSSESPEVLRALPAKAFANQAAQVVDIPRSPADGQSRSLGVPNTNAPEQRADVTTPEPQQSTPEQPSESPRHPRLSPVGRIPAVVSRRDRDRKLSDNSFSRPFARAQPRPSVKPPLRPGSVYNQIRDMASPIESGSQPVSSTSTRSDVEPKSSNYTNPPSDSTNRTSMDIHNHYEFFSFTPRKDSDQSYQSYSSSGGNPSWTADLYALQQPQQEDVWHEYNDFMDDIMPLKTPTTGSSLGRPFQYSSMLFEGNNYSFPTPLGISQPPSVGLPPLPGQLPYVAPTVLTVPQQISKFLQPSMSPLTLDTISGLVGDYGNRSTSTLWSQNPSSQRLSIQKPAQDSARHSAASSSRYSRGSSHSRSASLPEANLRSSQASSTPTARPDRDNTLMDIAEIPPSTGDARASASLRFGALMTSKWLSFGRVLFSPAHNEVQLASGSKVLVVDGLSSDWSYYVALSYPSAEVYNLSMNLPGSPSFSWPATDEDEKPPPNHRQLRLANIETSFPFPKGFFNAVVFRFPAAATEHAYTACISECKRVLRPGGFLEVAMLDLDLMNMGTRARKAVRDLKTRMQLRDQEVCLRNLSDIFVRLIGRRGFESVQRCIVGVPAAGRIPRSQDMSSISSDSETGRPVWQREAKHSKSQEFSFADLLEDMRRDYPEFDGATSAPGKNNDENITKMVAKVGRWWYSTCYEKALSLPEEKSIFRDPGLLRECEKQGTSFRLLICHAQKPAQVRRRTQSF